MRLKNKVIIVTGSTTGIGKAIAIKCLEEGAQVLINGLEKDLAEEILQTAGANATLHLEDITADGAPQRLVDVAVKKFGKVDAIVNNAAWVTASGIHSTDLSYVRKVFEVNTIAPFALIKAAFQQLAQNKGSVINIGSVNAYSGEPNLLAYSMSKGALMTMTRNLGDTLFREYGIRVNQVNPGWVLTETEIARKREQGLSENWFASVPNIFAPAGRILHPEEIACSVIYFLSDESGPVSGQTLDVEQYPLIGRNLPKSLFP
jgi:NAD(P)-dependent dehydrogenase (short-subunit alcohol dehydrogenase family)